MRIHIMRLAVQDLRGSTIRKRAVRLGRVELWALYQELLWALHENGGTLSSDPKALADELEFWSPEQIAEMLPLLAPAPGRLGGIEISNGLIRNERVEQGLDKAAEYSAQQSALGARGGRPKGAQSQSKAKPKGSRRVAEGSESLAVSRKPLAVAVSRKPLAVAVSRKPSTSTDAPAVADAEPQTLNPSDVPTATDHGRTDGNDNVHDTHVALAKFPSKLAADLYLRHYPKGTVPGAMFKQIRPLVEKHGWEAVAPQLEAYLLETDTQYLSWPKFASAFGSWGKAGKSNSVGDRNIEYLKGKLQESR